VKETKRKSGPTAIRGKKKRGTATEKHGNNIFKGRTEGVLNFEKSIRERVITT